MNPDKSASPVALVTGAGTGIGRACAVRFAELGHDVVVNYSRSEQEAKQTSEMVQAKGQACLVIQCDVSSDKEVRGMAENIQSRFGRLDVLVNNAGTTQFLDATDLDAMTDALWDRILAVNLKAPFYCVRSVEKMLRSSDRAAVVNVSSVAGVRGIGSCHAYSASKGGLNALTKSLALALSPDIRVNAVCPGPVDGRWMRQSVTSEELAKMTARYPLPRPASPDDIAKAVIYLALEATHTTGQLLVIDGGRTM